MVDVPLEPAVDLFFRAYGGDHFQVYLLGILWTVWKYERQRTRQRYNRADDRSFREWFERSYPPKHTAMFPLEKRAIGGYAFKQRTFYLTKHLGVDYKADQGTRVFAPCDGQVVDIRNGLEGGITLFFRPDGRDVTMRFMHLRPEVLQYARKRHINEGEPMALTGNTGMLTTGPHLHLDISHGVSVMSGNLDVNNFIDPETWDWNYKPVPAPEAVSVPVVQVESPAPEKPFAVKIGKYRTNARNGPSLSAGVFQVLDPGATVACKGTTTGDSVNGSAVWFVTAKSTKYIHSSLATKL